MTFKLNHELRGGHVHIAVFSGPDKDHLGKCGDLVMREEEWPEFRAIFQCADYEMSGLTNPEDLHGAKDGPPEILMENLAKRQSDVSGIPR